MKVWVAIIEERHSDVDAEVFTAPDAAIGWTRRRITDFARNPEDVEEELTDRMRQAGWIYFASWSGEGDSAHIIEKETDPWWEADQGPNLNEGSDD